MTDQIDYIVKICLLGEAAVGKTSLVYRFIENKFRDNYKSTLGVNLLKKDMVIDDYGGVSCQIWDLGGQESFKSLRRLYLEGANGALVIFDTTKRKTFEKLDEWIHSFKESRGEKPLLLIGNKIDLEDKRNVKDNEANDYATKNSMDIILTSAKTGENVEKAFKALVKTILDGVSKEKNE
ncbi:MAG: GTP-binding protein [Promethearchaeota archaeon]|nr:MAG: GTP-binding protein [Candidatus Lokiarchaeota archaeon]